MAPKRAPKTAKPKDGTKTAVANKNGKKSESRSSGSSFFTWFIVLALLGVWTSVAVVYFDLVDYQGVFSKLVAYDTDGDGDFDVEDAKVLLGLTSEASGQSPALDWLEEVEEGGSDWLNTFFTFLYELINPLDPLEDEDNEEQGAPRRVSELQDDDEEEEEEQQRRGARDDGKPGQKIVIVGLQNQ